MTTKKLLPPLNVRAFYPRCCANCIYRVDDPEPARETEVGSICERSGMAEWGDPEDMHNTICDRFKMA